MRAILTRDGVLHWRGQAIPAAIGHGGIRADKIEGDGATPIGLLPLRQVFYRADRLARPRSMMPVQPIAPNDGWCDDRRDPAYNRAVSLPHAGRHETLWRADALYDVIGVLGWNDAPPVPGRGSAIFLHVATPDRSPTEGCIALPLPELLAVMAAGLTEIEVQ